MKNRSFILLLSVVLFSSCFVKSLHPFYTKETISFNKELIGTWKDNQGATWEILAFKDEFFKEHDISGDTGGVEFDGTVKLEGPLKGEDAKFYEEYKNGYYIKRTKKGKEAVFFANPFKVQGQYFLDFTPLMIDLGAGSLIENHLVGTHSLVKFDVNEDQSVRLNWLDESRLKELFDQRKIKIEHERTGIDKSGILLTAKSKELQKFIKKYMASKNEDKWDSDTKFTLTKANAKP